MFHKLLYIIIDAMNTQTHESTGSSPYELVFGQKPRSVLFPISEQVCHNMIILEEEDGVNFSEEIVDDICANDRDEHSDGADLQQGA